MMKQVIDILLADSNPYFRIGLRHLLAQEPGLAIIGECDSAADLLAQMDALDPDVVLLDCHLPGLEEALDSLRQPGLTDKVIAVSASAANPALRRLAQSGTPGYLLRSDPIEMVTAAIQAVAAGHGWISPPIAAYVPGWLQADGPEGGRLSEREMDALALVAQGRTNQVIARQLELSSRTVDFHLKNAMRKLNAGNRTVAVLEAIRRGWLEL